MERVHTKLLRLVVKRLDVHLELVMVTVKLVAVLGPMHYIVFFDVVRTCLSLCCHCRIVVLLVVIFVYLLSIKMRNGLLNKLRIWHANLLSQMSQIDGWIDL